MHAGRLLSTYLLITFCAIAGCGEPAVEAPIRPVRAMKVGAVAEISGRSFTGRARPTEEVNLSFRVSGPLVEFPVKVGDRVAKDQVLAKIDPRDFEVAVEDTQGTLGRAEAELEAMQQGARPEELEQLKAAVTSAQAEYERALAEYQRGAQLVKEKVISATEFDRKRQVALKAQADLRTVQEDLQIGEVGAREEDIRAKKAEIRSLQAALNSAEDQLGYTHLKAPFEGDLAATYVENFETVQAQQQILRLLDTSQIEMVIDIPESLISNTSYVKDIVCVFDAFPDVKIEGAEVKEIGTEASQTTRTYPVTLIMDQPDPATGVKILPGMAGRAQGRAELPDGAAEEGFDVPESAVFAADDGQQCVWVIELTAEDSGTVRRQPLAQVRPTSLGMHVIGIQVDQWIATAGVDYLREGQTVRILSESGAQPQ